MQVVQDVQVVQVVQVMHAPQVVQVVQFVQIVQVVFFFNLIRLNERIKISQSLIFIVNIFVVEVL